MLFFFLSFSMPVKSSKKEFALKKFGANSKEKIISFKRKPHFGKVMLSSKENSK